MQKAKFVYWSEDGAWVGYFQDYPDYWTQGETLDDLKDHLVDFYHDLTSDVVGTFAVLRGRSQLMPD